MGNCVHPEGHGGHGGHQELEELFPQTPADYRDGHATSAPATAFRNKDEVVDVDDVETAAGSDVTCERLSRSSSVSSPLSLQNLTNQTFETSVVDSVSFPDFSGKWVCSRVEGDPGLHCSHRILNRSELC